MREGFKEVVSGWTLIKDVDVLGEYIEAAATWAKENGPLENDEAATVKYMIECQIAQGIERGDFEPYFSVADRA
jgi:hypothetical protein